MSRRNGRSLGAIRGTGVTGRHRRSRTKDTSIVEEDVDPPPKGLLSVLDDEMSVRDRVSRRDGLPSGYNTSPETRPSRERQARHRTLATSSSPLSSARPCRSGGDRDWRERERGEGRGLHLERSPCKRRKRWKR
jgi:hypothetical protein